jgi:probable F420-dependent oxidoreductase
MGVELGRYGVWARESALDPELARDIEAMGYGAIWVGGSPPADLTDVEALLAGTERIAVATGIVNMWAADAGELAASYHRIAAAHPGRFLLGVGIGHPEATTEYRSPFTTIVSYLDALDAAGVPAGGRALAALGPKVLDVAAARTAGAHPYLTTPAHTREARGRLGAGVLLAPEQTAVIDTDAGRARATGRSMVKRYLGLRNYVTNLRKLGFTGDDVAGEGSDRLIDALVATGDGAAVAARLDAHLTAGADHVCVQVLGDDPRGQLRTLAAALPL